MVGMVGDGNTFVLRDNLGIRPSFYYQDDEVFVVASERPAIMTAFNCKFEQIKELTPGSALIIDRQGNIREEEIIAPAPELKKCSFERIYFSRGSDKDIYTMSDRSLVDGCHV